ncbi:type VI secretion system contractile sheath large subunit [Azospirillum sp. A29]|jgi:type VI secretion system protein ImpC|uniref:type VI secretion system contractile sheath large subunit n=1 Tax=Azospirillum sp. A29 TaxID=3160606 RepID=UPI00366D267C
MSVESTASASLLDRMMVEGKMAREEGQRPYARDLLSEFVDQVVAETGDAVAVDVVEAINHRIAQIDELISLQLNEVLHHEDFQKLEATWRGLNYLVMNSETGKQLKIRVLNSSRKDLQKDLDSAVEFDQSALFKMVYEAEYGTLGGTPYSVLIGDYEFGRHPQDMSLIEKISNVAAAAHAPFIAAASPKMFDMDSFSELSGPRDLSKIFETAEMTKWRSFRASEDSRYVALVMPHTLLRLPYGPKTVPVEGVNFVEDVDGRDHSKYLWGNAAWALGARITDAFAKYGWTAAIRGVEGGGRVGGLPTHTFKTDEGDVALKCPTEIAITDRREKELNDLGFISLVHCKNTDYAAFFGGQTANKPKVYNTNEANANARLSAMLPYMLVSSRFAHYLKVMLRDKIGSFTTRGNVQSYLNTWIGNYILLDDDASQDMKARFPLREARVDVYEVPGRPGVYRANVFLRPHFQLEELSASIRLVAELPAPEA